MADNRFVDFPLRVKRDPKVAVRLREGGAVANHAPQQFNRLVQLPLLATRNAEQVRCIDVFRMQGQSVFVGGSRVEQPACLMCLESLPQDCID